MTSIATSTIVIHFQPFFIVIIGALFLNERLSRDQLLWIIAAFVGLVLASGVNTSAGEINHRWISGIAIALLGALFYAITATLGKRLGPQRSEVTAFCQTLMGIVIFAPFVQFNQHISPASWGWLLGIGVIHSGIAWVIIYSAYPKVSTPVIAVLSFVYPVVAIFIDWAVYGHPIGLMQAAGMALIAVATLGVRLGWRIGGRAQIAG